jgi:hypothetical protein
MRMELGTGHGRETELHKSVKDVIRTLEAIPDGLGAPRSPNGPVRER